MGEKVGRLDRKQLLIAGAQSPVVLSSMPASREDVSPYFCHPCQTVFADGHQYPAATHWKESSTFNGINKNKVSLAQLK